MRPRQSGGTLVAALLAGWGLVAASACVPRQGDESDGRVPVVATTSIVGDAVARVGGDRVRVSSLMGPGVDPHLYRASEGDVRRVFRAEVIFYNGLHLEARMGEVLEHMGGRARVVAVAESVPAGKRLRVGAEGAYDPHVWFDVRLWMQAVERIVEALSAHDPAGAAEYRERGTAYLRELGELDAWVERRAAQVPPDRRVLVTAHDAFGYFGRAYGFEVEGLQGISTAAEAGTGDVQALAELIARREIPAIFVESSVPERTLEAVVAAVRARGGRVRLGGELYSDALGDPGGEAGTYVGMVRHNVDTIVGALLGEDGEG